MFDVVPLSDGSVLIDNLYAEAGKKRKVGDQRQAQSQARTKLRCTHPRHSSTKHKTYERCGLQCDSQAKCVRHAKRSLNSGYAGKCCENLTSNLRSHCCIQERITKLQKQLTGLCEINQKLHNGLFIPQNCSTWINSINRQSSKISISPTLPIPFNSCYEQICSYSSNCLDCFVPAPEIGKGAFLNTHTLRPSEAELHQDLNVGCTFQSVQNVSYSDRDLQICLTKEVVTYLVKIYDEEIHINYPIIDIDRLYAHIDLMFSSSCEAVYLNNVQQRMLGEKMFTHDMTIELRLVLACALVINGQGQHLLGQRLYRSVKEAVNVAIAGRLSIRSIQIITLAAVYCFQGDREVQAWRYIGIASRQCLEMGLHRQAFVKSSFPNFDDYKQAIRIYWTVYALDRRWSFSTGMPFLLRDSDIDPKLPEPDDDYPDLKYVTPYNRIGSEIWYHSAAFERSERNFQGSDPSYLDFRIRQWYENLPHDLRLDPRNIVAEGQIQDRRARRLRLLMFLRRNQARISLYRRTLYSTALILENRQCVELVVEVAVETINTIIEVHHTSDIYRTQQVCYNYFLVQALVVIFLAVAHAPTLYYGRTQKRFNDGINLVKSLCPESCVARRLWTTISGLQDLWYKVGQSIHATLTTRDPCQQKWTIPTDQRCVVAAAAAAAAESTPSSTKPLKSENHVEAAPIVSSEDSLQLNDQFTVSSEMFDPFSYGLTMNCGGNTMDISSGSWQGLNSGDIDFDLFLQA